MFSGKVETKKKGTNVMKMDQYLENWLDATRNEAYREYLIRRIEEWLDENTNAAYRQWLKVRFSLCYCI